MELGFANEYSKEQLKNFLPYGPLAGNHFYLHCNLSQY